MQTHMHRTPHIYVHTCIMHIYGYILIYDIPQYLYTYASEELSFPLQKAMDAIPPPKNGFKCLS